MIHKFSTLLFTPDTTLGDDIPMVHFFAFTLFSINPSSSSLFLHSGFRPSSPYLLHHLPFFPLFLLPRLATREQWSRSLWCRAARLLFSPFRFLYLSPPIHSPSSPFLILSPHLLLPSLPSG